MNHNNHRDFFAKRIESQLIGPGNSIYGLPPEEEIMSTFPLQVYFSGILFPKKAANKEVTIGLFDTLREENSFEDSQESEETIKENSEEENISTDENMTLIDEENNESPNEEINKEMPYIASNSYFPSNYGFSFCVDDEMQSVDLTITLGQYKLLKPNFNIKEKKIAIEKESFENLVANISFPNEVRTYLVWENGYMFFIEKCKYNSRELRNLLKQFNYLPENKYNFSVRKLDFLINLVGRCYKRKTLKYEAKVYLENTIIPIFFEEDKVIAQLHIKVMPQKGRKYIKLVLENVQEHWEEKYSFANEKLNEKCFFQIQMQANGSFMPYKNHIELFPFDEEANTIAYQYQDLPSYGVGHGCAVEWQEIGIKKATEIHTTFLPKAKIRSVSNDFRKGQEIHKEIANLKNLSVWTHFSQKEVCEKLRAFADAYQNWIQNQKIATTQEQVEYRNISANLIAKQQENYDRIVANIDLLAKDKEVYQCFLLANTAMYIQMILSQDNNFGKTEKDKIEIERNLIEDRTLSYNSLSFFENYQPLISLKRELAYRPFQLAFFLINIESLINPYSTDRNEVVDLIWFPTGGGKTEAYLAVSAFTIIWRRLKYPTQYEGVAVIMRYTLRLLTSQQFERASRLICALEFMRKNAKQLPNQPNLGNKKISIGMWVGGGVTPNKISEATDWISKHRDDSLQERINKNPFQISACPFCGCKVFTQDGKKTSQSFQTARNTFNVSCLNDNCSFSYELPIDVIDESLYQHPPTLLFATVDKFAQIPHKAEGHVFFNSYNNNLPPDLIIQDELHLLNGPLGSIVGLFELMVEMLCTKNNSKPKIIASTATTRNTEEQIQYIYNRKVNIFPPSGIRYNDSYFSFTDTKKEGQRSHIGFMPVGKTAMDTQVRAMLPNLLYARMELYDQLQKNFPNDLAKINEHINPYWTIVSYYNTLKDLGKTNNKVNDEVLSALKLLHEQNNKMNFRYLYNYANLVERTEELTSRIKSAEIKKTLKNLEKAFELEKPNPALANKFQQENYWVKETIDLVLASNMFSVGIDISRLNIMLMNGQPKNIAEYIQASSRVARNQEGWVINLLDANRAREKSYFEHYLPFHQAYYQFVEPLTVTPFTDITLDKVLNSILLAYIRHKKGLYDNKSAKGFKGDISELIEKVKERIPKNEIEIRNKAENMLKDLVKEWKNKIEANKELSYKDLITQPHKYLQSHWALMTSMREVDTNSFIEVNVPSSETNKS